MTRLKAASLAINLALLVSLAVFFERSARAYTDPGSALLLFQGVSAFVTGALFYFRRRIRGLLSRSRSQGSDVEGSN